MITWPNALSFLRIPLAFLLLSDDLLYRTCAIVLAIGSDMLDGYLARRWKQQSQWGAYLDPITDKFFMITALAIFVQEGRISVATALLLVSRDIAVLLFAAYLFLRQRHRDYRVESIITGKVTTFLQAVAFLLLLYTHSIPSYLLALFPALGVAAFLELLIRLHCTSPGKAQGRGKTKPEP